MTALKAIRAKCLDCAGGIKAVRNCPCPECTLYSFRLGHNHNRAGIGNSSNFQKKPTQVSTFEHDKLSEGNYTPENENASGGVLSGEK